MMKQLRVEIVCYVTVDKTTCNIHRLSPTNVLPFVSYRYIIYLYSFIYNYNTNEHRI